MGATFRLRTPWFIVCLFDNMSAVHTLYWRFNRAQILAVLVL
jgi:hypothetical protein